MEGGVRKDCRASQLGGVCLPSLPGPERDGHQPLVEVVVDAAEHVGEVLVGAGHGRRQGPLHAAQRLVRQQPVVQALHRQAQAEGC